MTNVNISNPQTPVARCCSGNRKHQGPNKGPRSDAVHTPPCGKKIDPRVTSPCPEHIESSVESSQPLTSSHRVHLSAEITASEIDSINPAGGRGGGRPSFSSRRLTASGSQGVNNFQRKGAITVFNDPNSKVIKMRKIFRPFKVVVVHHLKDWTEILTFPS